MRGLNRVIISGSVDGDVQFSKTSGGFDFCSFFVASDRPGSQGTVVTCRAKISVYAETLIVLCQTALADGVYVIIEGELMSRNDGDSLSVRARDIVCQPDLYSEGESYERTRSGSRS